MSLSKVQQVAVVVKNAGHRGGPFCSSSEPDGDLTSLGLHFYICKMKIKMFFFPGFMKIERANWSSARHRPWDDRKH